MIEPLPEPDRAGASSSRAAIDHAVRVLAHARSECVKSGLSPLELGRLLLDEALLAFLIDGQGVEQIRAELQRAIDEDVRPWVRRAELATGQCDCVAEVHLQALLEARLSPPPSNRESDGTPFWLVGAAR